MSNNDYIPVVFHHHAGFCIFVVFHPAVYEAIMLMREYDGLSTEKLSVDELFDASYIAYLN